MPSGVVPHYRPCLLMWCLLIGHAFRCSVSLSAMHAGDLPQYRPCLLVWCLIIHACWFVASLYAMPSGVVPHYQPYLLVWGLTSGHTFWCSASLLIMPVCLLPHFRSADNSHEISCIFCYLWRAATFEIVVCCKL